MAPTDKMRSVSRLSVVCGLPTRSCCALIFAVEEAARRFHSTSPEAGLDNEFRQLERRQGPGVALVLLRVGLDRGLDGIAQFMDAGPGVEGLARPEEPCWVMLVVGQHDDLLARQLPGVRSHRGLPFPLPLWIASDEAP